MTRATLLRKKIWNRLGIPASGRYAASPERWIRLIDPALLATTVLMLVTDQIVLWFHIIFVLLALGSFFWKASSFVIHSVIWVSTTTFILLLAVQAGQTQAEELIEIPLLFLILTTVFMIASRRARALHQLEELVAESGKAESMLAETNQQLEQLISQLDSANQRNERRAKQFETIAQVARATTTTQNIDILLANLVQLISEKFDFYHAGIFLLDEEKENAVLRAANSKGGKRMLERGHNLKIGQAGIVGHVTALGKPRIALDVGDDAIFFDNPDLPATRSEMALPLRVADEIIGALDVQSTEANAFQQEDIDVLSTLADQVSVAIQSARSYETTQLLLAEARKVSDAYWHETQQDLQGQEAMLGYLISGKKVTSLEQPITSAQIEEAITSKATVKGNNAAATLAVPIRLRDEVIGVIHIRELDEHEWEQDEVDITEAVAERLSLALESAMLLKSTQRRAEIERMTADITGKIGSTTQFDSILRTAAEELSRVLGGSEVLVQIQSELAEKNPNPNVDRARTGLLTVLS